MADEKDAKPLFTDLTEAEKKYKDLQRELEKSRKREREAVARRMDTDELKDMVQLVLKAQQTGLARAADDDDKDVKDLADQMRTVGNIGRARRKMAEALVDAGLEYEELEPSTKKLYEEGKIDEAVASLKTKETDTDFEARVAAEVARKIREGAKVDTGGTAGPGGIPTDALELNEKLKDPKWRKEHRKELVAMAAEGKIDTGV